MKAFKPLMFAVLAGLPLAVVPAMAASESAGSSATGGTTEPAAPSQMGTTNGQATTVTPGVSQRTPPNAPAKSSAVAGEGSGSGGGK